MGTALSTGGGLTDSQKKAADDMGMDRSEYYQMLLNNARLVSKHAKDDAYTKAPKKKDAKKSASRKRQR
jgi:hypothetical protein